MGKQNFRAKKVEEKIPEYIIDSGKILHTLTKPRAQQSIAFVQDKDESDFINVLHYKTKTGEITNSETIVSKEVEGWLTWLTGLGYIKK